MPVKKETHTRCTFAYERAEYWLKRINANQRGGNIISGKATYKFLQAYRIYVHYNQEYQKYFNLPLCK